MTDQAVLDILSSGKRHCWYVAASFQHANGQLRPSVVFEDTPAHFPTTYEWGTDLAKAQEMADRMNTRLGITKEDAEKIVESSVAASLKGASNAS